jgi:hypothetical protein
MTSPSKIEETHSTGGNSPTPLGELRPSRRHGRRANVVRTWLACLMSMIAAVLCAPPRAHAATVIATITGTVENGTDYTGVFIAPNGNLTGYPFTLVFTMDATQGVPLGGTWPADCGNGLQSSGLTTPVPQAVLAINGKSYTFGTHIPTTVSSWVYSANATSPQTILAFALRDSFDNPSGINGYENIWGATDLDSIYACRDWESAFSYTLVSPPDVGRFQYEVDLGIGSLVSPFVSFGEGYLDAQTVNVSGPITTPHIFFLDPSTRTYSDVTNSSVRVVVGEQIQLFAEPPDSAKGNHWSVPGKPIGGYTAMVCKLGASCNPGSVTAADFANPVTTQFYWYEPGTYTVKYSSGASDKAETTFYVAPARVPTVAVNEKMAGVSCQDYPKECDIQYRTDPITMATGLYTGFGNSSPPSLNLGILFNEYGSPGSGSFQWVQLIRSDDIKYTTTNRSMLDCPASPGLDGRYPYAPDPSDPYASDATANDSPGASIDSTVTAVTSDFSAQMYLMWTSNLPNSIPVPLGSVKWRFVESSKGDKSDPYGWTTPTVALALHSEFSTNFSDYPKWDSLTMAAKRCPELPSEQ